MREALEVVGLVRARRLVCRGRPATTVVADIGDQAGEAVGHAQSEEQDDHEGNVK